MDENSKVQTHVDPLTKESLKKMAEKRSMPLSKYVARILENHVDNWNENQLFQMKTQAMLAQILSSVLDYDISKTNAPEVKKLIQKIETEASEKLNSDTLI